MRMISATMLFVSIVCILLPLVHADRGGLPIDPGVSIYEPGQKAIIAWNGNEEILILSTDLKASQQTTVLEILPLPSIPEIGLGSFQSFEKIQQMIWMEAVYRFYYGTTESARGNSVEIVFHEEIGAHNITVVAADNPADLIDWANNFLQSSSIGQNITLGKFQSAVQDYMGRGFRYYALDLVTLQTDERSMDPIVYRFNSSVLYYPLLITSPVGGDGDITLFLFTENRPESLGTQFPYYDSHAHLRLAFYQTSQNVWKPIQFTLSTGELSTVDIRVGELLPDGAWLSVLTYQGNLALLTTDLTMTVDDFDSSGSLAPKYIIVLPTETIVLFFVLGAVSALSGVGLTFFVSRSSRKSSGKGSAEKNHL